MPKKRPQSLCEIDAADEKGIRVVVETPRGSSYKLKYEAEVGSFAFSRALPLGVTYPYDFGFVPQTLAPDGDPLDVLLVHDASTHPGVVVCARLLGVIRLSQKDEGEREENDRVIAVPVDDTRYEDVADLPDRVKRELEQFFLTSVEFQPEKKARVEGWGGARAAHKAVKKTRDAWRRKGGDEAEGDGKKRRQGGSRKRRS